MANFPFQGLIRRGIAKYVTQVGQLRYSAFDEYGDTQVTTISTTSCLVYTEREEQDQTVPAVTGKIKYFAVIGDITSQIRKGDMLTNVIDKFGNSVISDARIVEIIDFDHWRHGRRFRQLRLDLDLDA